MVTVQYEVQAQDWPMMVQDRPKTGPRRPKMLPRWLQEDPWMIPRGTQGSARESQGTIGNQDSIDGATRAPR